MKRGTTLFLKVAVWTIGAAVLALCTFLLPKLANEAAGTFPEYAYLHDPVLIGLYITAIPYFFAIFQALKLLKFIEHNNAFSELSVNSLKYIKYCASVISALYIIGSVFLLSQNALHPGVAVIGFTITFASIVIAVFAALLQKLLKSAIDIKSENDLTV
ncbi:membrane protein [Bacillus sp. FJAT-27231]|uniref:DUF2975 domain-containing protein n=1 Tax=Bacillus sp. FJAT-27231 TaxID=1679168 RepID=UPI0006711C6E|nr:DUF2975 domain-containing protein [Bacillus sp. FJAT-27231]KMY54126.1 membrane protein [Bacillus sp. FJAT-27231]